MHVEEWRTVPGYPYYDVSSLGQFRTWKNGRWGRRDSSRPMKTSDGPHGYQVIGLINADGKRQFLAHRVVLFTFVGPPPDGMESCHENNVRDDNKLSNLRWDTHANNIKDRRKHGTLIRGEQSHLAKLTASDVAKIRASNKRNSELAIQFSICEDHVSGVRSGRVWSHLPGARKMKAHGERCGRSKLTRANVLEIMGSDDAYIELARRFGVTGGSISAIRNGRTWRHVTGLTHPNAEHSEVMG